MHAEERSAERRNTLKCDALRSVPSREAWETANGGNTMPEGLLTGCRRDRTHTVYRRSALMLVCQSKKHLALEKILCTKGCSLETCKIKLTIDCRFFIVMETLESYNTFSKSFPN